MLRTGAERDLERHRGFEPLSSAWKAEVLPARRVTRYPGQGQWLTPGRGGQQRADAIDITPTC